MKTLCSRLMARRKILAVALGVATLLVILSTEQLSDKERMRRLLCAMHSDDQHSVLSHPQEVDENGNPRNGLQWSIDKINEDILMFPPEHSGEYEQRLPQAIIIGVRKCGTRALLEMLRLHPSIAAANPEIHFFDDHYKKGLDWYKEQMPFSYEDQITMEKTPAYFITSEAPERIYRMNSSIKLLAIVRDPTVRAVSDYTQIKSHTGNVKNERFPTFEERVIVDGEVDTSYQAIRISMYANFLRRWQKYFPPEQLMFVDGAKLILDPLPEMKKVENFLGLDSFFTRDRFVFNATKGFYCLRGKKLKCLGDKKGQSHPEVDPKVLKQLQDFFRPYNQKLFQLIGQEFDWS